MKKFFPNYPQVEKKKATKNKVIKNKKDVDYIKRNKKNKKLYTKSNGESDIYESSDKEDSDSSVLQREVDDFLKNNSMSSKPKSEKLKIIDEIQKASSRTSAKRKRDSLVDSSKTSKNKKKEVKNLADSTKRKLNEKRSSTENIQSNIQSYVHEKFDISELKAFLNSDENKTSFYQDINKTFKRKGFTHMVSDNVSIKNLKDKNKVHETQNNTEKKATLKTGKAGKRTVSNKKEKADNSSVYASERNHFKEKLIKKLQSASFRILNEQLYTSTSSDAFKKFHEDPDIFKVYHEGYSNQIANWPINPLTIIISWLRKRPKNWVVADFGCGDATLAKSIKQKVYSIDLVALSPEVIECDMAHTPLESTSVNVVIFCLSLMGKNLKEFILEANRVLVVRGVLKIAEVESRFSSVKEFSTVMLKYGFRCIFKNQRQDCFWIFDFLKIKDVKLKPSTPELNLTPCIYKKR